jgi:signal transduction histidine kinase
MEHDEIEPGAVAPKVPEADSRGALRTVAHDINGALNNISLNLELLDRAAAAGDGIPEESRQRYMGNLRRAVAKISEIVSSRLVPLARPGSEPGD